MKTEIIGVVGAGVMGCGVAQNLAQTGYAVILYDVLPAALERARHTIQQNLRFHGLLSAAESVPDPDAVLGRITFTSTMERLEQAVYVVENVIEKRSVKHDLFEELDRICGKDCIFASNTSAIPITRLAASTGRPDRFIGIHFMNPVPLSRTVELIRGYHTSDATVETTKRLLSRMGKEFVLVGDSPGFVSNRVLMLTINEAVYLLQEKVASPEGIDAVFQSCLGHKMGPLATADLIGLDTVLYSIEVLHDSFADSKYRPCPLLRHMVDAGLLGRKTGQGFFAYPALGLAPVSEVR